MPSEDPSSRIIPDSPGTAAGGSEESAFGAGCSDRSPCVVPYLTQRGDRLLAACMVDGRRRLANCVRNRGMFGVEMNKYRGLGGGGMSSSHVAD